MAKDHNFDEDRLLFKKLQGTVKSAKCNVLLSMLEWGGEWPLATEVGPWKINTSYMKVVSFSFDFKWRNIYYRKDRMEKSMTTNNVLDLQIEQQVAF